GPMLLISAVVSGPAHAIAQRWLAGHLDRPLTDFVADLTDAACAGLRATPASATATSDTAASGTTADGTTADGTAADGAPADGAAAGGPARPVPARSRVTLELLADDGSVLARGQASAQLIP